MLHWHINADEALLHDYKLASKAPALTCGTGGTSLYPSDAYAVSPYRSSDHDPVLVGLNLYNTVQRGTALTDVLTGGPMLARTLATLLNVSPTSISPLRDRGVQCNRIGVP